MDGQRWSKEGEFAEALANGTTHPQVVAKLEATLAAQAAELAAMREALQIIANPDWTWATPEEMRKIASDRLAALGERRT